MLELVLDINKEPCASLHCLKRADKLTEAMWKNNCGQKHAQIRNCSPTARLKRYAANGCINNNARRHKKPRSSVNCGIDELSDRDML
jgi:hypothetical protein